jgi:hypothetical protein
VRLNGAALLCGFAEQLPCLRFLTTPLCSGLTSQEPPLWLSGLSTSVKRRIGQASGFDKFVLFGPLSFAIAMVIFGADHLVAAKLVATIVPSWIPGHLSWVYFVGALIVAALSLAT